MSRGHNLVRSAPNPYFTTPNPPRKVETAKSREFAQTFGQSVVTVVKPAKVMKEPLKVIRQVEVEELSPIQLSYYIKKVDNIRVFSCKKLGLRSKYINWHGEVQYWTEDSYGDCYPVTEIQNDPYIICNLLRNNQIYLIHDGIHWVASLLVITDDDVGKWVTSKDVVMHFAIMRAYVKANHTIVEDL